MKFNTFEEMPVWMEARKLTTMIYTFTKKRPFSTDFGLRDQSQRASVSIMSNIAEGYERASRKEFAVFLSYAKGSVGELRAQLYVAHDLNYIDKKEFDAAHTHCLSISKQLDGFMKYLKKA